MAMTADDIRRHPAYKHGFEGHRKYHLNGNSNPRDDPKCTHEAPEFRSTTVLLGEKFSVHQIWIAGAHAGMENCRGWTDFPSAPWHKKPRTPLQCPV